VSFVLKTVIPKLDKAILIIYTIINITNITNIINIKKGVIYNEQRQSYNTSDK